MHLTFQEFFAASYIKRLLIQNPALAQKLIQTHKLNPQYQIVWWFASGLLKTYPENLNQFFETMEHPKDLIGFYDFQLKARCLDECGWSDQVKKKRQYLEEAKFWCQWLVDPNLHQMIGKSLIETLKMSPLLSQSITIPLLLEALKDEDRWIKLNAVQDLVEVSQTSAQAAKEVIPALLDALKDPKWVVKVDVIKALGKVGKANAQIAREVIHQLLEVLDNSTEYVREATVKALGQVGKVNAQTMREVIPGLLKALADQKGDVRKAAVKTLGEMAKVNAQTAIELIPQLLEILKDPNEEARGSVVKVLGEVGKVNEQTAKEVISRLLGALKDPANLVREAEFAALEKFCKANAQTAKEVIPRLLQALKDPYLWVREAACEALGKMIEVNEQTAREVVPRLLEALKEPDGNVRKALVTVLRKVGKINEQTTREVIPRLLEALKDRYLGVREAAFCSLVELSKINEQTAKEVTPRLLEAFKDSHAFFGAVVVQALGEFGKVNAQIAKELIPQLLKALKNQDFDIRKAAFWSLIDLSKINEQTAKEVIPRLLEAFKDPHAFFGAAVIKALGELGKVNVQITKELIPQLLKALKNQDFDIRKAAFWSLIELSKVNEQTAKEVIPRLLETDASFGSAAEGSIVETLESVMEALGEVGKINAQNAMEVIPGVLKTLTHPQAYGKQAAIKALGELIQVNEQTAMKIVHELLETLKNQKDEDVIKRADWALKVMCKANVQTAMKVIPGLIKALKEMERAATKVINNSCLGTYFSSESLMSLIHESFQCTGLSLSSLLKSYGEQEMEEATYLAIIMTKCCTENIPLFLDHQSLCFYHEGFQSIALPKAMDRALILGDLARKYPQKGPLACGIKDENQEVSGSPWDTRLDEEFALYMLELVMSPPDPQTTNKERAHAKPVVSEMLLQQSKNIAAEEFTKVEFGIPPQPFLHFFQTSDISYLVSSGNPIIPCGTIAIAIATLEPTAMNQELVKACIAQGKRPDIELDSPCVEIGQRGELCIDLTESLANNKKLVQSLEHLGLMAHPTRVNKFNKVYILHFRVLKEQIRSFLTDHLSIDLRVYHELCQLYPLVDVKENEQKLFVSQT